MHLWTETESIAKRPAKFSIRNDDRVEATLTDVSAIHALRELTHAVKEFLPRIVGGSNPRAHAGSQNITFDQADRLNPYYPFNITKADLNKDGYPDLMFSLPSSRNIYTLISNKSGNYVDWTIPTSYCPSTPIGVGDFKRDGSQNILVGYPSLLTRTMRWNYVAGVHFCGVLQ
jgi:hypothetical protein